MKYKELDMLKPMKLYVNGTWMHVTPVYKQGDYLLVKNTSNKVLKDIKYRLIDLKWHFSVAEGLQIKNSDRRIKLSDKVKFLIRSWL